MPSLAGLHKLAQEGPTIWVWVADFTISLKLTLHTTVWPARVVGPLVPATGSALTGCIYLLEMLPPWVPVAPAMWPFRGTIPPTWCWVVLPHGQLTPLVI